jgi:hypothetical protein
MAERGGPPNRRPADVPSLAEKGQTLQGREAEFAMLNKQLRACFVCKLIKATPQVGAMLLAPPCAQHLWSTLYECYHHQQRSRLGTQLPLGFPLLRLQWMDSGCDNCRWMDMSDMESLDQCTTTNFSG